MVDEKPSPEILHSAGYGMLPFSGCTAHRITSLGKKKDFHNLEKS